MDLSTIADATGEVATADKTESATAEQPAEREAVQGETSQFVTFTVGEEAYAVDILQVREIKGWTEVTRLPNQPAHMRGVLNLRGVIVPIFDLRCRFGQGLTEATPTHVVVIVAVADRIVGILVDTVSDILTVGAEEIRAVPDLESRSDRDFLKGLATSGDRMVALLQLDKLFDLNAIAADTGLETAEPAKQAAS